MRSVLAIAFVALAVSPLSAADSASPNSRGVESLGSELLEDLAPNAFDQPDPRPLEGANNPSAEMRSPTTRAPRFDDLGEDIGQPSGSLSLVRVRQGMQHAESLLAGKKAVADVPTLAQAGEAQTQVVAQLDKIIAELSKQCKGGQCQSGNQSPKPSQRSQKKPGKSGNTAGRGQTAARDSTDRLDSTNAKPIDKSDIEAMVKDLWGHLPERSREQMMQSFSEEFLPKYELEIEQYYRRLSEQNAENRPQ
ncbi:MAG: hypothetical protein L0228_16230 [Planctomycetes bacterium]|nr:hypothetical protein [Planctomycetota bacterium]